MHGKTNPAKRRIYELYSAAAYEPYVATTCNNLALFYADNGRPRDAEPLYQEALAIRRRLAAEVSAAAYEPDVAMTCYNFGLLYHFMGKGDKAAQYMAEAKQLAEKYKDTNLTCRRIFDYLNT